ncbi:MAG: nitronate monooxygenase [Deltaproteobacteria bacterium HGW-Deltaproteobacteria-12]|jgi:enoyl-[acyl-carrier protein] reductase II|nr:MAG: nitronate monooxygenase [Deltaproteobacteria bacterium HGW-Deltaproteobacteria-12]
MSNLLEILGSRYPIIQGPIGAMNDAKYIAAVCDAGAFGMISLGFSNPEETRRLVDGVKSLTDKPFGANVMIMNPANPEILKILAAAGVKFVSTSAGSPSKIYPLIHELGMKGFHVMLALSHAIRAAKEGVDGLIVSGLESGGLRSLGSESTTMILVPLVADHVKIPVVAAGGIADRRGYRAALALGAQGVQIGTRLIASEESPAPPAWKKAILDCGDGGTRLLSLKSMMMRVIPNQKMIDLATDPAFDLSREYNLMNAPKGWMGGDFDLFPAGAGQVAALISEIKPIREIIAEMVS